MRARLARLTVPDHDESLHDRGKALNTTRQAGEARSASYNLFRRREEPDLYCAVPQPRPVPAFVSGDEWEFAGAVLAGDGAPLGFDPRAALAGARLNGFYVFLARSAVPARRAA